MGQRTKLVRDNGADTTYAYENALLLDDLDHDFTGTVDDLTVGFEYNPPACEGAHTESSRTDYDSCIGEAVLRDASVMVPGLHTPVVRFQ